MRDLTAKVHAAPHNTCVEEHAARGGLGQARRTPEDGRRDVRQPGPEEQCGHRSPPRLCAVLGTHSPQHLSRPVPVAHAPLSAGQRVHQAQAAPGLVLRRRLPPLGLGVTGVMHLDAHSGRKSLEPRGDQVPVRRVRVRDRVGDQLAHDHLGAVLEMRQLPGVKVLGERLTHPAHREGRGRPQLFDNGRAFPSQNRRRRQRHRTAPVWPKSLTATHSSNRVGKLIGCLLSQVVRAPGPFERSPGLPSARIGAVPRASSGQSTKGTANGEPRKAIWGTPRGATLEGFASVPARWPMDERKTHRRDFPLTIPDALLQSEVMRQACAARNFQEIFRLVNRRTGSSYAVIPAAVGKMTSSRVSDIIRGVRGIRGQGVIERISDGFGIPGEMLGLPMRPWEKSCPKEVSRPEPLVLSPPQETKDSSPPLTADTSTVSDILFVSAWIEGRRQIVPISRRTLLAGAVGAGLQSPEIGSVLHHAIPKLDGSRIEAATEHLKDMWHTLVRADNLFGPRHALASVRQQISILESLLEHTRGDQRLEVLRLAAQYAESAAWLHEDSADLAKAARWTSQAMEWATESGDQAMVTWTLFRRSQQATTKRNPGQTISLAQAVQRNEDVLTAPMRAAALQQEAHGYALDGDEITCHKRLDSAHEFAASRQTKGDARSGHGDFCTPSYIEIQRANCWLSLDRPDRAAPVFEQALTELPDAYQRDRGLTQARLAMAYAGIREYDEAAEHAASALSVARGSGSARTMHETVSAINALGAVHASPAVTELFDAMGEDPELWRGEHS